MSLKLSAGRISAHPILEIPQKREISFRWQGKLFSANDGEMVSSALIANGIYCFGHHHRDGAPQGIFCANGQCSHCLVIANGLPAKVCITPVHAGMEICPVDVPRLPEDDTPAATIDIPARGEGCGH
jgi:sarcosine oxidase subunit alpha